MSVGDNAYDALRLIRLFREPGGRQIGGFGVFHLLSGQGWQGSTVFTPGTPNHLQDMLGYLEQQRVGSLLYPRKRKK